MNTCRRTVVANHTPTTLVYFHGNGDYDRFPIIAWIIDEKEDDLDNENTWADPVVPGMLFQPDVSCLEFRHHDGTPYKWAFVEDLWFDTFEDAARHGQKVADRINAARKAKTVTPKVTTA